jgi:predicted nucleotide-binding protein
MKPTLFVGSSSESLDVAYAAQRNLEDVSEVVVWTQGIFELTKSYLESLLEALDDTEFGLFILGADDLIRIRGTEMPTARDNVIFELGLFIGRLGRRRSKPLLAPIGSKLLWDPLVTISVWQSVNTLCYAIRQVRTRWT